MRGLSIIGTTTIGTLATLALAGCAKDSTGTAASADTAITSGPSATATLRLPDGGDTGTATAQEIAGGVRIRLNLRALPPGVHGVHVHTTGRCDPPDFASAGAHWNPANTQHGVYNPKGPHQGDLPNLEIAADGRGTATMSMPGATLAGLLDTDGSAIVVHAKADDLTTDPSGNSGARLACGVFAPG